MIVLGVWLLGVSRAQGDIALSLLGGYAPFAKLQKTNEALSMTVLPLEGEVGYYAKFSEFLGLAFGLNVHHARVIYFDKKITYAGVYNAQGASLSLVFGTGNLQLHLQGQGFLQSSLSARAEINSEVNDGLYKHSTVVAYKGQGGTMGRLCLLKEVSNGQLARYTRLRLGVSLETLQQPFSSENVNVNSNDPVVGASGDWTSKVSYQLQYSSVSLLLGIIF